MSKGDEFLNNNDIYTLLRAQFNNNPFLGNITFNTEAGSIIIYERDIIGNAIQSWLASWLDANNVSYGVPASTQVFPDYIINPNTPQQENLEVKSWYSPKSPAFDIANFESYIATLQQDPAKLDTDYLIFRYDVDQHGNILIDDLFLKKIWEITCPSNSYALKVQEKRNVIYNIRPATWYSTRARFSPFNSKREFVQAVSDTLVEYRGRTQDTLEWYDSIENRYIERTGRQL